MNSFAKDSTSIISRTIGGWSKSTSRGLNEISCRSIPEFVESLLLATTDFRPLVVIAGGLDVMLLLHFILLLVPFTSVLNHFELEPFNDLKSLRLEFPPYFPNNQITKYTLGQTVSGSSKY
ncbi:unnamed protein product [Trichobilharzia szidati]|nr:unnamed protein product [Trichobilharzia szidati]